MNQIEGKSQRIIADIEVVRNHINLNKTKLQQATDEISSRKAAIAEIEGEQKELERKLQQIGEEQVEKEKELQRQREQLNQMKAA